MCVCVLNYHYHLNNEFVKQKKIHREKPQTKYGKYFCNVNFHFQFFCFVLFLIVLILFDDVYKNSVSSSCLVLCYITHRQETSILCCVSIIFEFKAGIFFLNKPNVCDEEIHLCLLLLGGRNE